MSISRSSKGAFWPALDKVKGSENSSPFVLPLYDGDGKPTNPESLHGDLF